MSITVRDEQLSAYLDGHLDSAQRVTIEAALLQDSDLRARLEALQHADGALRAAFPVPPMAETPERFRRMIVERSAPANNVTPFVRKAPVIDWRMPIAAGLALAIGAGGGFMTGRGSDTDPAMSVAMLSASAEAPLYALLETTPAAVTQQVGAAGSFKPVLTFRASDGRYCREFEVSHPTDSATGVACRSDDAWRLEMLVASNASDGSGYAPVSGPETAIDAALDRLGASAPLSAEEETALLKRGWTP